MRINELAEGPDDHNLLVFSGWYSDSDDVDERDHLFGDSSIRQPNFHTLWFEAVQKFLRPDLTLITDSNSPAKSPLADDGRITWISLPYNPGHPTSTNHFFAGCTVAMINGLSWAVANRYKYAIYVEQDALIFGDKLLETAISDCKNGIALGSGTGTPQAIQQSLMVFELRSIPRFLRRLLAIPFPDSYFSTEDKFAIAASRFPIFILRLVRNQRILHLLARAFSQRPRFGLLSFGYGRHRPIDFSSDCFYFQHGTASELEHFVNYFAHHDAER